MSCSVHSDSADRRYAAQGERGQRGSGFQAGWSMGSGMVSEYDPDGMFGLIDADDGRLLLFNLSAAPSGLRERFRIGMRVTFELEPARSGWGVVPLPVGEAIPDA